MPRLPEAPPPGVVRQATPDATPGRWYDLNNMRWRGNVLQPIGGNQIMPNSAVTTGPPLDIITWHDNFFVRWAAFGTASHLYAYNFETSTIHDITPAGIGTIGGPSTRYGYGKGAYGAELYGTPRTRTGPPQGLSGSIGDWWSMDTFGALLMVVPTQDGHLYKWDPSTPAIVASVVSTAPAGNRGVIVTDQRSVVLYGANSDPRLVMWSDQEDFTVWTPSVSNLAGSQRLVTQSFAMTAVKTGQGVLIFTGNDVHLMTYVGPPYAYGITQIGTGCGPISIRAPVAAGSLVAWPSWQNFWVYSGSVQPLPCDVKDWFFGEINQQVASGMFGTSNAQFSEIWWDWPSGASNFNDRYLAINYGTPQKPWLIGQRQRTAGDRAGVLDYPILGAAYGSSGGALFQHEIGWLDNGATRLGNVYAESSAIVMGEGERRYNVMQIVFDGDTDLDNPAFGVRFLAREQPFGGYEADSGLYTAINENGLLDTRVSGRHIRVRLEATRDWHFGVGRMRFDASPGGTR